MYPDDVKGTKEGKLCYYIDNEAEKNCYMYLRNSRGFGARTPYVYKYEWMVETLETTPDGWHVVAFAHEFFQSTTSYPNHARETGYTNFYSVPFDFSDNAATVEHCVAGDNHRDNVCTTEGGIPIVLLMTDGQGRSKNNKPYVQDNKNTADEHAISAFIFDYDNRTLNIGRTGANGDIVVPLTAVGETYFEPTTCTDLTTEETVISGKPNSSGEIVAAEGYGTVYVELPNAGKQYTYHDDYFVRLDGVDAAVKEYQLAFYKYDENGERVFKWNVSLTWTGGVWEANNSVGTYPIVYDTDENGKVVYIDFTAVNVVRKGEKDKPYDLVAISAKGLTADSIITYC